MMDQRTRLYALLGGLALVLGVFTLVLAWPLITGTTVVLETEPVDPFDILRGQYLVIRYDVSTVPVVAGADEGSTVYVSLQEGEDGIWRYSSASLSEPSSGVFLRGTVDWNSSDSIGITYGIEQYFFERNARVDTVNMTVEAKVSADGSARITRLLNNGTSAIRYENKPFS